MGLFDKRSELQRSYDVVADAYVQRIYQELDDKPADRALLDRFAEALGDSGPAIDLGCGPGHITRYLHEHGIDISGVDISAKMVKQAKKLNPGISFKKGDLRQLKEEDNHYSAAVAMYSLIHIPPEEMVQALLEIHRVLEPGGALLLAFHVGNEKQHLAQWWDRKVDLDFYYFRTLDMIVNLQQAGFEQVSTYTRNPYPEIEAQTKRTYILAEALPGIPKARRSATLLP